MVMWVRCERSVYLGCYVGEVSEISVFGLLCR